MLMAMESSQFGGLLAATADHLEVERHLEFEALPSGWGRVAALLLTALAVGAVVWMYRREGRAGASPRRRTGLAVVRSAVLLVLAGMLLEPVWATYLTRWVEAYTLVLVDDSASMGLQDRYRDPRLAERVQAVMGSGSTRPPPDGRNSETDAGDIRRVSPAVSAIRRIDLVQRFLSNDHHEFLAELLRRNAVRVYSFSDSLERVATLAAQRDRSQPGRFQVIESKEDGVGRASPASPAAGEGAAGLDKLLSFAASGRATNAGRAIRRAMQENSSSPVAGVIVLTDGGFTESDAVEVAASAVREHPGAPGLYLVGVGDPSPPVNLRVAGLSAPESAFAGDPFEISAHVTATGWAGGTVDVDLYEQAADDEVGRGSPAVPATAPDETAGGTRPTEHRVERRTINLNSDETPQAVRFVRQAPKAGRYVYRVEVPVRPEESVADDNRRQTSVSVVDSRLRVLLVAGAPSWEYRFLSRLLERDDAFDVSCWLQSADRYAVRDGDVVIDHLPATAQELFQYDAVVLLDPDPRDLTREWCELAARLVTEYGGGLLYEAARLHTPALVHQGNAAPVLEILPVALDPEADLVLNRLGHYQQEPAGVVVPEASLGHPVMKLVDDPAGNRLGWQRIGQVYWYYPVLREKPVASVLMRRGDPGTAGWQGSAEGRAGTLAGGSVLAATQFVGAGRTGFLAFDGTWRWRAHGEDLFNGFWVRMLRYLVEGKLLGSKNRGLLLTDKDTYELGAVVWVQARVLDERFEPLAGDPLRATYQIGETAQELILRAAAQRAGWFEGRFVADRTGSYEISLEIPGLVEEGRSARRNLPTTPGGLGGGSRLLTVRREVQVLRPDVEVLRPQMNREALLALAAAAGAPQAADSEVGRYYEIDEARRIAEAIPDRHETTTVRSQPVPMWDRGWMLTLLVGLLCIEWALRKWWGML